MHPPKTRPVRIVAVDDEPFVLEELKRLFQHAPKEVALKTFTDSHEAWQELLRTDTDLLITDDIMTSFSLCGTATQLRASHIIAVCKRTGQVLYEGSAGDEG